MKPYYNNGVVQLYQADARAIPLPDQSVHCVVTSPPYFGLRVYQDNDDQGIGLEGSIEAYVANLVDVFREVRRVLRDDGVCWVNLGDSYGRDPAKGQHKLGDSGKEAYIYDAGGGRASSITLFRPDAGRADGEVDERNQRNRNGGDGGGQRLGIPERVVMALQADGWIWRDTVIWAKKSAMPQSVNGWRWERCRVKAGREATDWSKTPKGWDTGEGSHDQVSGNFRKEGERKATIATFEDCPGCPKCEANDGLVLRRGSWRTTSSHEYIYMLTKGMGYYCDAEAVKTAGTGVLHDQTRKQRSSADQKSMPTDNQNGIRPGPEVYSGANRRSVWNDISPEPYGGTNCPGCGESFKSKVYKRFPNVYTCQNCEYVIILSANKSLGECPECNGNVKHDRLCIKCEVPLQSHFATFPSDLPRICIQASTADRGVCPECGSQWARVVENSYEKHGQAIEVSGGWHDGRSFDEMKEGNARQGDRFNVDKSTTTIGWRATCNCQEELMESESRVLTMRPYSPVPATVLDPFAGTATTCLAAQKLGRRSIGVDISEPYLNQAVQRLSRVPLPLPAGG